MYLLGYETKLIFGKLVLPDPLAIQDGWIAESSAGGLLKWPSLYYHDISQYLSILATEFIYRLETEYK